MLYNQVTDLIATYDSILVEWQISIFMIMTIISIGSMMLAWTTSVPNLWLSELFFQSPGRYTQTIICIPLLRRLCSVHAKFSMTSFDTLEKSKKKRFWTRSLPKESFSARDPQICMEVEKANPFLWAVYPCKKYLVVLT